jgi:hypothetical protein
VLATLTILRVLASSLSSKDGDKFQVKCITFSQPPVGNAALREYVISDYLAFVFPYIFNSNGLTLSHASMSRKNGGFSQAKNT